MSNSTLSGDRMQLDTGIRVASTGRTLWKGTLGDPVKYYASGDEIERLVSRV